MATRKPPAGIQPTGKSAVPKTASALTRKDPGKEELGSQKAGEEGPASNEQQAAESYMPKAPLDRSGLESMHSGSTTSSEASTGSGSAGARGRFTGKLEDPEGEQQDSYLDSAKVGSRDRYTGGLGQVHDPQQGGITLEDLDASFDQAVAGLSGREDAYGRYTQGLTGSIAPDPQKPAGTGQISEQAGMAPVRTDYEEGEGVSTGKGSKSIADEYGNSTLGKVAKFYETGGASTPRGEMLRASDDDGTSAYESYGSKDGVVKVTKYSDGTVVVENSENNTQTTQKPDGSTYTKDLTSGKVIDKTDALEDPGDPSEAPPPVLHGPDPVSDSIDELRAVYQASKQAGGGGDVDPDPEGGAESAVDADVPDAHSQLESMLGNPGSATPTDGFGSGHTGSSDPGNIDWGPDATDPNTVGRTEEVDVSPGGDSVEGQPPGSDDGFDDADDPATVLMPDSEIADTVVPDDASEDLPDHVMDVGA